MHIAVSGRSDFTAEKKPDSYWGWMLFQRRLLMQKKMLQCRIKNVVYEEGDAKRFSPSGRKPGKNLMHWSLIRRELGLMTRRSRSFCEINQRNLFTFPAIRRRLQGIWSASFRSMTSAIFSRLICFLKRHELKQWSSLI